MAKAVTGEERGVLRPAKPRKRVVKRNAAGPREPATLDEVRSLLDATLEAVREVHVELAKQQAALDDLAEAIAQQQREIAEAAAAVPVEPPPRTRRRVRLPPLKS